MSENMITGRAKKYDGTAIDYVSIFNWGDGKCIAQVVPDASGNWQYSYSKNLEVGLTYIANGCEPITHGLYYFSYEAPASPIPTDYILAYTFNGDTLDSSINALHGIKSGNTVFVEGRKAGTQALNFISGLVKTPSVLPINSDKLTVSFWVSTTQTGSAFIYHQDKGGYAASCVTNYYQASKIESFISDSGGSNLVNSSMDFQGNYQHVLIEIDKSQPAANEQKIYINNVLSSSQHSSMKANTSIPFDNSIMFIGRGNDGSFPFDGKIQDMRFYNRILTELERTKLFNE